MSQPSAIFDGDARGRGVVEVARRRAVDPVPPSRGPVHHLHDPVKLGRAEQRADLRHLGQQLPGVALGQAPGDDEPAALPPRELRQLQDRPHRLLPGGPDEGAGVDHQAVGPLRALGDLVPGLRQVAQHDLRIHLVLGAAERGEVHLHERPS